MKPIYEPQGKAKEYGDYAINIYTGCPHRCYYCFAPNVLHREREQFHSCVEPRKDIVAETAKQIKREHITGKLIHLCFSCDPYPKGYDSSATREIIKLLKDTGNSVQILTKNGWDAIRDFDLLDSNDWFGVTYAGYPGNSRKIVFDLNGDNAVIPFEEPCSGSVEFRLMALEKAHKLGINTWVSAEPVLNAGDVLSLINRADYVDLWKVGKLNYHKSYIDWKKFGAEVEYALQLKNKNYYIKESLRKEMEKP